jgi:hypothetical protein
MIYILLMCRLNPVPEISFDDIAHLVLEDTVLLDEDTIYLYDFIQ